VASHLKHSVQNGEGEYAAFANALKKVVSVPHSTIKAKFDAEKQKRIMNASVSRVSRPSHARG